MTLSITTNTPIKSETLSITTFRITTLSITIKIATLNIKERKIRHSASIMMLSLITHRKSVKRIVLLLCAGAANGTWSSVGY